MTDTPPMMELKACPFCKAAPGPHPQDRETRNLVGDWRQAIWCESCDALGPEHETGAEAITARAAIARATGGRA